MRAEASAEGAEAAISVVVPTRDRPASLRRCLAALAAQDAPGLELVVVDDGSRDVEAVAAVVAGAGAHARLVRGDARGPAAARNRGVVASAGRIVCFTDDDCEPEPSWAGALAERAGEGAVAAGVTRPPVGASAPVIASQAITEQLQLDSLDPETGELGFAPTCNLAAPRAVLEQLPFDESFPAAAGEDREWCARAAAAGHPATYVAEAVVVHRPALDLTGFVRQQYGYGRGAARYRAAIGNRRLARPGFYSGLLRRGASRGAAVGALVVLAQVATAVGVAGERLSGGARRAPARPSA